MEYSENPYQPTWGNLAAHAAADERADFIRKTYLNLAGAVAALIGIEALLLQTNLGERFVEVIGTQRFAWLIVIGMFMAVSFIAERWARSSTSVATQYMGLGLYVVAESIVMLPLLYVAQKFSPQVVPTAALATGVLFIGLTAVVFVTGADFSWMRTGLWVAGLAAMLIVAWACISGSDLGIPFTVAMIAFACCYILYDTSNVMMRYRVGQHVAASLALFASVALLFWYVLRLLLEMNRR